MAELEHAISTASAFGGLDAAQLRLVTDCARRERVPAGTMLTEEGRPAERCFLIEHGVVSLEVASSARGPLVLATLGDGDMLGWSWLFAPYRWRIDGRVVEPTDVVSFDGVRLRRECEADHDLGYRLITNFAAIAIGRLQDTRLQLLDVYANPAVR